MIDVRTRTRAVAGHPLPEVARDLWPLLAAGAGAMAVAAPLVLGQGVVAVLVAALPLMFVAVAAGLAHMSRVPATSRMVGTVSLLLVASTFVWRGRTTEALNSNPLDNAGIVRIGLVGAAALLAVVVLLSSRVGAQRIPTPLRFLGAYILVAALSALGSPLPLQAFYRALELGAGFLTILVASLLLGERAGFVLLRLSLITLGGIVSVIWIEALLVPSRAWTSVPSVVPYQLTGYLPSYSSNAVGTFGALLAIWGLARTSGNNRVLLADVTLVFGLVTLLASQYRTGIIGFLVAGGIVAWHRRRGLFVVIAAAGILFVLFAGWNEISVRTQTAFAKGRPELVTNLNSRTHYWRASLPLIRERPLLGWGLDVGSRRVLVSLGDEGTSTIHGTWVEALLGTGIAGTAVLAASFVTGLRSAWRARRHPVGVAVAGMIVFLVVRSITGTTVELFNVTFLIFVALVFAATQLKEAPHVESVPSLSRAP